ncbi:hypothetical protein CEXT_790731, partial [Caerostris extrusa]
VTLFVVSLKGEIQFGKGAREKKTRLKTAKFAHLGGEKLTSGRHLLAEIVPPTACLKSTKLDLLLKLFDFQFCTKTIKTFTAGGGKTCEYDSKYQINSCHPGHITHGPHKQT